MQIKINTVEAPAGKPGSRQNRVYTIVAKGAHGFYDAVDAKGVSYSIWNAYGNWSKIGIMKAGVRRMTYTTDFELIK